GVLVALERAGVPIDAVSGTSMGALVGGLYAAGYSAPQLDSIARGLDWARMFSDASDRRPTAPFERSAADPTLLSLPMRRGRVGLPSGVIAGQHLMEFLTELTWPVQTVRDFRQLPVPFSAVATDIATGEAVVLDSGSLAGAMRASMSLPSVLAPAKLGNRVLLDGALSRDLPVRDVRALGADVVICSDVSEALLDVRDLTTMVDVLNQAVSFHGSASTIEERKGCDIYMRPDLTGLSQLSYDRTSEWIARGAAAAQSVDARLRELIAGAGGPAAARSGIASEQRTAAVALRGVEVDASNADARAFVRNALDLPAGDMATPEQMQGATAPVFDSGLFETVSYSLVRTDSGTVAVVTAQGENADRVGFGFRYDDRYNAALLFDATVHHLFGFASTGRLSLRLGEQTRVSFDVARGQPLRSGWVLGMGLTYLGVPLDFYEDRRRVAEATERVASAHVTVGAALRSGGIALQLKGEDARGTAAIAAVDSTQRRAFASAAGLLWWSTMDRPEFARSGTSLDARYERAAGGGPTFSRYSATGAASVPVLSQLSLAVRATVGAASRDAGIPTHYRFFLGSLTPSGVLRESLLPFAGLEPQERNGFAVTTAEGAAQWEMAPNLFATFRTDVGNVGDTVRDALSTRVVGAGISLGTQTLIGPVELSVHGRSLPATLVELSVGHIF
ncbi:MAG TPA: patatin-like phospholipase family protein, partial [Gemmatimonadaceae bacterium]